MRVDQIELYIVELPLKTLFQNSQTALSTRKIGIIRLRSGDKIGYGEIVTFDTPWYLSECFSHSISYFYQLVPKILHRNISEIEQVLEQFAYKGIVSAFELALQMIKYSEENRTLRQGVARADSIEAGVVLGVLKPKKLIERIAHEYAQGYRRVKIKIDPSSDVEKVKLVRQYFPDIILSLDGNGSYHARDIKQLLLLREYSIDLLEQPFKREDLSSFKELYSQVNYPVFIDESYENPLQLMSLLSENLFHGVNLKMCKIGTMKAFEKLYLELKKRGIQTMMGNMLESSLSKMWHLYLGTWDHEKISDMSDYRRYFEKDLLINNIENKAGKILAQEIMIDETVLAHYTKDYKNFQ